MASAAPRWWTPSKLTESLNTYIFFSLLPTTPTSGKWYVEKISSGSQWVPLDRLRGWAGTRPASMLTSHPPHPTQKNSYNRLTHHSHPERTGDLVQVKRVRHRDKGGGGRKGASGRTLDKEREETSSLKPLCHLVAESDQQHNLSSHWLTAGKPLEPSGQPKEASSITCLTFIWSTPSPQSPPALVLYLSLTPPQLPEAQLELMKKVAVKRQHNQSSPTCCFWMKLKLWGRLKLTWQSKSCRFLTFWRKKKKSNTVTTLVTCDTTNSIHQSIIC